MAPRPVTHKCCDCGARVNKRTVARCRPCYRASQAIPERHCVDCGASVSVRAKRCHACHIATLHSRPEAKARYAAISVARRQKMATDPEFARKTREHGRKLGASGAGAACLTPEVIARRARVRSETMMAWCPHEYRDQYWFLVKTKRLRAGEAREIIEADIEAKRARLSPFERQAEALKKGARLVEKFVPPARDYEFTLGGISNLGEAA